MILKLSYTQVYKIKVRIRRRKCEGTSGEKMDRNYNKHGGTLRMGCETESMIIVIYRWIIWVAITFC